MEDKGRFNSNISFKKKIRICFEGLTTLSSSFQQRKLPLRSINLQSCALTHKSLYVFNTALITNNNLLKTLQCVNLSGNRIKEENVCYD